MSLYNYKYLNKHRLLTLTLILALTSTLFSVTAFSFLGFYNGFNNYIGTDENTIAIYGTKSNTPITGLVPTYLADNISAIDGVLATSPEVIAPCVINDKSIFIRGIIPESVNKLNPITITQGVPLNLNDTDSTIIGENLQQKLNLKTGDKITAFATISDKYASLQIKGVFKSNSPLDDEALVPIYTAQWLRSTQYEYVTLIRAKIDPAQTTANTIYQTITNQTPQTTPTATTTPSPTKGETEKQLEGLISISKNFKLQDIGIEQAKDFMKNYLTQYGVSKDTLVILSIIVLAFASGTTATALALFIKQHAHEIEVLRSIGASKRKIKTDLLIKLAPWSIAASTVGTIISVAILLAFQNLGYLQVLSHRLTFELDPIIITANFILILAIVATGVIRMETKP